MQVEGAPPSSGVAHHAQALGSGTTADRDPKEAPRDEQHRPDQGSKAVGLLAQAAAEQLGVEQVEPFRDVAIGEPRAEKTTGIGVRVDVERTSLPVVAPERDRPIGGLGEVDRLEHGAGMFKKSLVVHWLQRHRGAVRSHPGESALDEVLDLVAEYDQPATEGDEHQPGPEKETDPPMQDSEPSAQVG